MLRSLTIGTFVLMGAASVAYSADVFRWVDEHGGVHYSDQWVPGSEVIKSSKPRPVSTNDSAPRVANVPKPMAGPSAPASQQNTAQAVKQDVAKMREQQCKEAKDRYDKAIAARRIFKQGGDKSKGADNPDDRQYLSDEEADAYRVKARQEMQEFCGK